MTKEAVSGRVRKGLAATIGALAVSLALAGCVGGVSGPGSQGAAPVAGEFDTLTADGAERIKSQGSARLDMSAGKLEKESVGLPADAAKGPLIFAQEGREIQVSIAGPKGTVSGSSDSLKFATDSARADFKEVTFYHRHEKREDLEKDIRDAVSRYGLDAADAENWLKSVQRTSSPVELYKHRLGPGTSTGLAVTYDIVYDFPDPSVISVRVSPMDG
ncbi:hypothetical protein [Arthrobacter sp. ISL-95]|uniref:hypothetical protein n=1 Tax=Arthrobacter sp. ISL-95 TaxID=2819116 RepID=UPI001BE561C6|nr:hypothetical protein [Arthrobacter sp. ISL-95]MBT2587014.1 hypothetical protein [Arthrobacter sp. ISL-95]